jgi:hypothetical protein
MFYRCCLWDLPYDRLRHGMFIFSTPFGGLATDIRTRLEQDLQGHHHVFVSLETPASRVVAVPLPAAVIGGVMPSAVVGTSRPAKDS